MRGRKPKPTKLKIMAGNPGHRPLPKDEPVPRGSALCPSWLDEGARKVWKELAPELSDMGVLTSADAEQFGFLCTEVSVYRESPAKMPTARVALIKSLYAEFGMGPSSRPRLTVKPDANKGKARFFGAS